MKLKTKKNEMKIECQSFIVVFLVNKKNLKSFQIFSFSFLPLLLLMEFFFLQKLIESYRSYQINYFFLFIFSSASRKFVCLFQHHDDILIHSFIFKMNLIKKNEILYHVELLLLLFISGYAIVLT